MKKVVGFYYQTFTREAYPELSQLDDVTDLYLSAVHFGTEGGAPYIHLNDYPPEHFADFLKAVDYIPENIRVHVMLGGAGGGLEPLLDQPEVFFPLFQDFLIANSRITGVNLDIEEGGLSESSVESLVETLARTFPGYELSMAPIASPAQPSPPPQMTPSPPTTPPPPTPPAGNEPFSLAAFTSSPAGRLVSRYCVQMYGDFTPGALSSFLASYPAIRDTQIVAGTISGQFGGDVKAMAAAYSGLLSEHPGVLGIVNWELYGAPHGWAQAAACAGRKEDEREALVESAFYALSCPMF